MSRYLEARSGVLVSLSLRQIAAFLVSNLRIVLGYCLGRYFFVWLISFCGTYSEMMGQIIFFSSSQRELASKLVPSDPKNYRPIALTCTACKIFESLISSEILDYLNSYNLITPHQHGFLKKHSTATNLLESINDWSLSLSRRHSVDIAYIDFCRAFDAISHSKLLLKLSAYGFSGNLYLWIKAFLSDRKQLVRINSSCSSIRSVLSGVIQGSVLGPLLFNVFINDVTDTLDNDTTAKLFADDLKLYTNITTSSTHNL